ncbi:hypothetical protein ACHAQH_006785 [Verticillium albo-atrum]
MKFSAASIILFAGAVLAHPAALEIREQRNACSNLLYGTPLCCATSILGLANLDCTTPKSAKDGKDMKKSCKGKQPQCCTLGVTGIALLCQTPVGVDG